MDIKINNKTKLVLIIIVTIFTLLFMIKIVYAYFTDLDSAKGSQNIIIEESKIKLETQKKGNILCVSIENIGKEEIYARIKIVTTADVRLVGNNMEKKEDGYYYYNNPILAGEKVENILFEIDSKSSITNDFNVITVAEGTTALYDENGMLYADWTINSEE